MNATITDDATSLQSRIAAFEFDDPGTTFTFRDRLAKENNWSAVQTQRAIDEYLRFAYLAATVEHPVSPSDAVDQVWHLHLLYTRSYWDRFCGQTLGFNLHHEPTRGGADEGRKFADWYDKTLVSYRQTFGHDAPPDLWPRTAPQRRHDFRRVDLAQTWMLPKMRVPQLAMIGIVVLAILALAAGCDAASVSAESKSARLPVAVVDNPFEYSGVEFLQFFVFVLVLALVVAIALRWQARRSLAGAESGELDPFEIAYLRGGQALAVRAAVAGLVSRKLLEYDLTHGQFSVVGTPPRQLHPLETAILRAATNPASLRRIESQAALGLGQTQAALVERGLLVAPAAKASASIGTVLLLGVGIVGVIKVAVGISRERPVGYLIALTIVTFVIAAIFQTRRLYRTTAGDRKLEQARSRHTHPASAAPDAGVESQAARNQADLPMYGMYGYSPMTMMFALYGVDALIGDPSTRHMHQTLGSAPDSTSTFGSSGGSSDGSGGDGGGSGGGDGGGSSGCGGCGGGGGD
ncbi:MAG: TIGR04222 domain-containing membrane protein [Burkholderiales bacterium]|nr:TIGR04222 domain-containing membrane protein [Phycisphaerae bacterium]